MPHFSFASVRACLILILFLCVFPALGLTLYTDLREHQVEIAQTRQDSRRLLRLTAGREEQLIEASRQLLVALTWLHPESGTDQAECDKVLNQLLKHYPAYTNLGQATPEGNLLCSAVPLAQPHLVEQTWFQKVVQRRSFTVGSYFDYSSARPEITFSYPVLDSTGEVKSVLFTLLDLTWFKQRATEAELAAGALLQVSHRDGTLTRYPDSDHRGERLLPALIVKTTLTEQQDTREVEDIDGNIGLDALRPVGSSDSPEVYLAMGIGNDPLVAANRHLLFNLGGLGLVALLAIATAWIGSNRFLHPRQVLVRAVQQIAAGDFSARTSLPREGELGQLAFALDQIAETLEQHQTQLQRQALYDSLTQLPNRRLFMDRLENALQRARHQGHL